MPIRNKIAQRTVHQPAPLAKEEFNEIRKPKSQRDIEEIGNLVAISADAVNEFNFGAAARAVFAVIVLVICVALIILIVLVIIAAT